MVVAGPFNIMGGEQGVDWTWQYDVLRIGDTTKTLTISGNGINTGSATILIVRSSSNITFDNITLHGGSSTILQIAQSDITLTLKGVNTLSGDSSVGGYSAYFNSNSTVTISAESTGTLHVNNKNGIEIRDGSKFIIDGGTIISESGDGAGIFVDDDSELTINGGTVNATGQNGAGIGGYSTISTPGKITINGGMVTAK
jgi:hypothetical protein